MSRPAGPVPGATRQPQAPAGLLEKLLAAVRPEFRADELAFALDDPVFGGDRCRVGGCGRAVQARGLCHAHYARWHDNGQPDLDHYMATAGPVNPDRAGSRERQVHLGKLGRQLKLEVQYALQGRRDHSQGKTHPGTARRAVAVLAASGAVSILDLSEAEWAAKLPRRGDSARALLISARREVEDLREGGCRWDTEYPRDLWRLRALGVPGQQAAIRFGQIPQPWLKALAKRWARWRVAAGGRSDAVYQGIRAITRFGQFLAASKIPVQGLGQVDRDLIERYLAVLQHELAGRADHPKYIGSLNAFFDAIRRHGWDDTLPATAAIYPEDYPRARPQRLPRAVAEQVMAQVEDPANLALWDNPAYQLVTLILTRCGLRITDAIRLPFGCLVSDSSGAPYLRYLNHKMNREALVPVDEQLVRLIRDQQARVQDDYPSGQTVLFPQVQANRDGRKPMHGGAYRRALYSWLARCDIRDERGNPVHITPHQWRHTLGTALINRDVPQHVVQKILDHYAGDPCQVDHWMVPVTAGCCRRGEAEQLADLCPGVLLVAGLADGGGEHLLGLGDEAGQGVQPDRAVAEPAGHAQRGQGVGGLGEDGGAVGVGAGCGQFPGPGEPQFLAGHEALSSSLASRPSKTFCRPSWPLPAASSRWRCRVGRNSMVVWKKVQDSQMDSK